MRRHQSTGKGQRLTACPSSCLQDRPGSARIRAFFVFLLASASAPRCCLFFNKLPQDDRRYWPMNLLAEKAGRARCASPLHFGCVHALRRRQLVCAARDVRGRRPRLRAARHHVRRDARVWAQPKWIFSSRVRLDGPGHCSIRDRIKFFASLAQQDSERRFTKPEVARSIRARGASSSSRCSADGSARVSGTRGCRFEPCRRGQTTACVWAWPFDSDRGDPCQMRRSRVASDTSL